MEDCRRAPDAASSLQRRALPTNEGKSGRRRKPLRFQRGDDTVTTRLGDSPVGKVFWRAGKNLPFLQARPFLQSKNFKAGKFYVSVISGSAEGDRAARGFKSGGGYFLMGDCDGMNDNASKPACWYLCCFAQRVSERPGRVINRQQEFPHGLWK